jgi:hypothetical protein
MKFFKAIGTVILLALLFASIALTLASAAVRFAALNPKYLKAFMPTKTYCAEMRERVSEDLDHVALLYGVDGTELPEFVTDDAIRSYTNRMIDALFAENATAPLKLPAFPADGFAAYARTHTSFGEEGIRDFSEDCAKAVTEDLSAINTELIIRPFLDFRGNTFCRSSMTLFVSGALLTLILLLFLRMMYTGPSRRAGSVVIQGGMFMGMTLVFVPVMQFLLFGYVDRLNISVSAFRTILTGFLNTVLYGCFLVLFALEILTFLFLLIAIARAAHGKKTKKGR